MYDELKIGYFCASDSAKIGYEKKTNPTTRIAIPRLKDLITVKNSDEKNFWFQNSNLGSKADSSTVNTISGNVSKLNNKVKSVTLATGSWSGTAAPYKYIISDSNIIGSNTIVQLSLPSSMEAAQRIAYRKAQIESGDVSAGKLILYAFGSKPSENIPITLSIGGGY